MKPKPPAAPDYGAAAQAQGAANVEAARTSSKMSNPNVVTPQGTRTVTYGQPVDEAKFNEIYQQRRGDYERQHQERFGFGIDDPRVAPADRESTLKNIQDEIRRSLGGGDPDVPTVVETLNPEQQKIFENEQQLQQQLGFLGIKAADMAGDTITQPLNFNERFGTQAQGRQQVIDAMMSRYDQDAGRQKEAINSDLIARGIPAGSKAYEVEMDRLGRARNDALQQATIAADTKSMDERRQAITEALAERQVPLNEISAFRTGSQIQPLQFSGMTPVNAGAAPVFNAADAALNAGMDQYGIRSGNYNNFMNGLFSLGAAALGGRK